MPAEPQEAAAARLFETLSAILTHVTLSEIAISPYVLPLASDTEGTDAPSGGPGRFSPPAIHPFALLEDDKLVVPQKPLYLVYTHAVRLLSELDLASLRRTPPSPTVASDTHAHAQPAVSAFVSSHVQDNSIRLDGTTRIILLQNPEYVKALNIRKRLLLQTLRQGGLHTGEDGQCAQVDCTGASAPCNAKGPIQAELAFTCLLLGISANAKMATLWHHRKWCLHLLCTLEQQQQQLTNEPPAPWPSCDRRARHILHFLRPVPSAPSQSQSQSQSQMRPRSLLHLSHAQVQDELSLVVQAVQRYPRNYQAWSHRTWLITSAAGRSPLPTGARRSAAHADGIRLRSTVLDELDRVRDHVRRNVTDHTAVAHALRLLAHLGLSSSPYQAVEESGREGNRDGRRDEGQEWLALAKDLVERYGSHETPWLLLRGVVQLHSTAALASSAPSCDAGLRLGPVLHVDDHEHAQRPCVASARVGPLEAIELGLSVSRAALAVREQQASERADSGKTARQRWQILQDDRTQRHAQRSHFFFGALLRGCGPGRTMETEERAEGGNTGGKRASRGHGLGSEEGRALLEACRSEFVEGE